jgi:hypothetical protein
VISDNNRNAKLYAITKAGTHQMKVDRTEWERRASVIERILSASSEGGSR